NRRRSRPNVVWYAGTDARLSIHKGHTWNGVIWTPRLRFTARTTSAATREGAVPTRAYRRSTTSRCEVADSEKRLAWMMLVLMIPGHTAVIRTPRGAISILMASDNPTTANLVAQYTATPGIPKRPRPDAVFTMWPRARPRTGCSSMRGRKQWIP